MRDHEEAQCDDEAQTLTDLFDQLGRAAFKRALAHRDVGTPRSAVPKAGNGKASHRGRLQPEIKFFRGSLSRLSLSVSLSSLM